MVAGAWRSMSADPDDQLRRESPAYRPDDAWTEVEAQSLGAVFSVRFDAASARRIVQTARRAGVPPSRLIRDWTVERLSAELDVETRSRRTAGVREVAASYHAQLDSDALRDRYRPEEIDILLVGGSRPTGGSFFYAADSNLYYATHEAFQVALGPMPSGAQFLELLQRRGVWLYDLADAPVNRMRGRPRRAAVQARVAELADLLRTSQPRRVVAVKRDLDAPVRQALNDAGLGVDRLTVLPFPLYQWRDTYVRELAALVGGRHLKDEDLDS